MLISHEVPKALFQASRGFNCYPYVLGHLIKLDRHYRDFYKEEIPKNNFSILDNSAFELGASIPDEELLAVIRDLRPTHFVLPDTVWDQEATLTNSFRFLTENQKELTKLGVTPIGVVQGDSFLQLYECVTKYQAMGVNFIAIPFDCIKEADYSICRFQFFKYLLEKLGEEEMRKLQIHFLGIKNPQELLLYSKAEKELIFSIDTSSPILHGVSENKFTEYGSMAKKPAFKLADNLDIEVSDKKLGIIYNNINFFRQFTK